MSDDASPLTLEQQLALCRIQFSEANLQMQQALRCCERALLTLQAGNYGVSALLLDAEGECLFEAENRVFSQGFTPAAHAEMRLLDQYQAAQPTTVPPEQLTLLTLLEPCPMCFSRILLTGIGRVKYLVADTEGGCAAHPSRLPPAWQNLSGLCSVEQVKLPDPLFQLASNIAFAHQQELRRKLLCAIRPAIL